MRRNPNLWRGTGALDAHFWQSNEFHAMNCCSCGGAASAETSRTSEKRCCYYVPWDAAGLLLHCTRNGGTATSGSRIQALAYMEIGKNVSCAAMNKQCCLSSVMGSKPCFSAAAVMGPCSFRTCTGLSREFGVRPEWAPRLQTCPFPLI